MDVEFTWESYFVIALLGFSLIIMAFDLVAPDLVFATMVSTFMVARVITTREGAAGFANTGVLTVVALYAVAEGLAQTGGLERLMDRVLGRTSNTFWAQVRMLIPVMVTSAFLNNTPIVALMIPILLSWSRRCGVPAKKLLIPLSYGAVFGGTITLIGTSTNLVVSSLQQAKYKDNGFTLFTITPYGVPYMVAGFLYMILFSPWLLAGKNDRSAKDVQFALRVSQHSKTVGRSVREFGRSLVSDAKLVQVSRHGRNFLKEGSELTLQPGDLLYFTGDIQGATQITDTQQLDIVSADMENVADVEADVGTLQKRSLGWVDSLTWLWGKTAKLVQVNVSKKSDLIGSSIHKIDFPRRFGATVVAVKRPGQPVSGRLSDVVLAEHDVLVFETGKGFSPKTPDFKLNFQQVVVLDERVERRFTTAVTIPPRSNLVGKRIVDAGIDGLQDLFLIKLVRESGEEIEGPSQQTLMQAGDVLWYSSSVENVNYLLKTRGFAHVQEAQIKKLKAAHLDQLLVQIVVANRSPLAQRSARGVAFRELYDATVLAIHRHGEALLENVADVKLQVGDVLVLRTGNNFNKKYGNDRAFALAGKVPHSAPPTYNRMWIASALALGMVTTQIVGGITETNYVDLFPAAVVTAAIMVFFRCMTGAAARGAIDWPVYICIAFAFGLGTAMEKTDVAQAIANAFADLSILIGGQTAILSCMYFVTALLSELLTNNAAAAIMYPIASAAGDQLGVDPNIMSVAVMLGASAGFISPYSYQCNLMVYTAGNYRFTDFVRFGLPLTFWLLGCAIIIFAMVDHLLLLNILSLAIAGGVLLIVLFWTSISHLLGLNKKKQAAEQEELLKGDALEEPAVKESAV